MSKRQQVMAVAAGIIVGLVTVVPFVLAINRFDWGVGMLLLAPLLVWLLMRAANALERWASDERKTPPVDPDYPDSAD